MMRIIIPLFFVLCTVCAVSEVTWEQFYYRDSEEVPVKIYCSDSLDCLVFINNMGMFRLISSTDGGAQWSIIYDETWEDYSKPAPDPMTPEDMQYPAKNYLYITYEKGILKASKNRGASFDTVRFPTKFPLYNIHMMDSICGIASTRQELYFTDNGWKSFEQLLIDSSELKYINNIWIHSPDKIDFISSTSLAGPVCYRTTDKGLTWIKIRLSENIMSVSKVFYLNNKIGWITGKERTGVGDLGYDVLFRTTDGGDSWELNYRKENDPAFGLQDVLFTDEKNGVAVGQFGKILRTTDGGINWFQEYYTASPDIGLPPLMVLGRIGSLPVIGVFGRGMLKMPGRTSVSDCFGQSDELKVYPNPFDEYVNFRINTPIINNSINIEIYSPGGQKIESSRFDNISADGIMKFRPEISVPGVYVYIIKTGEKVYTGKMIRK